MDIGQLKHEQARQGKLNLERTLIHMYDLPRNRRRCDRSCSWYPGTWSPKSSRRFVSRRTPVLGCRSRLSGSLVGQLPNAVARTPVDRHVSTPPTSATSPDLLTDSADPPPVKKHRPLPCTLPSPGFAVAHQQTLLSTAEA